MYSIKKHKKLLGSILLTRGLDIKSVLLISGVFKNRLKQEKELSRRMSRSCFINISSNIIEKSHLVKVENQINIFNSVEKFDLFIKSKNRMSFCSVYHKKLIFTDRTVLRFNSLFWGFIQVKLISILILK